MLLFLRLSINVEASILLQRVQVGQFSVQQRIVAIASNPNRSTILGSSDSKSFDFFWKPIKSNEILSLKNESKH